MYLVMASMVLIHGMSFFDPDPSLENGGAINLGSWYDNSMIINGENNPGELGNLNKLSLGFWLYSLGVESDLQCTDEQDCTRFFRMIDANGVCYDMEVNGNGTFFFRNLTMNATVASFSLGTPIHAGNWYHIGVSIDADEQELKLYYNGNLIFSAEDVAFVVPQNPTIYLGEQATQSLATLSFCMDELLFYRAILSETQFQNLFQGLSTHVEEINTDTPLEIFPNPLRGDRLYWESSLEIVEGAVFSVSGQLVQTFKNPENFIELRAIEAGSYFVVLNDAEGYSTIRKFIKQ